MLVFRDINHVAVGEPAGNDSKQEFGAVLLRENEAALTTINMMVLS